MQVPSGMSDAATGVSTASSQFPPSPVARMSALWVRLALPVRACRLPLDLPFQQLAVPGEPFRQDLYLDLAVPGRAQDGVAVVTSPVFLQPDDYAPRVEPVEDLGESLRRSGRRTARTGTAPAPVLAAAGSAGPGAGCAGPAPPHRQAAGSSACPPRHASAPPHRPASRPPGAGHSSQSPICRRPPAEPSGPLRRTVHSSSLWPHPAIVGLPDPIAATISCSPISSASLG